MRHAPSSPLVAVLMTTGLMLAATFYCTPARAQVGMVSPTPGIAVTSPLGMTSGSAVPPTGIGMGATELPLAGLSPAPVGEMGMAGAAVCSATGFQVPGVSGTSTTYDGGGMTVGGMSPGGAASSGTCGSSTSGGAASPGATLPSSSVGASAVGIPLGSVEIGGAGLSPLPSPSQFTMVTPAPTPVGSTTSLVPSTIQAPFPSSPMLGVPCATPGTVLSSTGC
jgi:hypothetical protein